MKSSNMKRRMSRLTFSACALMFAGGMLVSCEDTLLTGMPSWLGASIYDELAKRGEYQTTLKLIDDPAIAQTDVLKLTGSKTLFVAKDEAFQRFFKDNSWGVTKFEELSDAQKKMLFNSSMVNSAYLIELLSNTSGGSDGIPTYGSCMRRTTALSLYDSVPSIKPIEMPKNDYWKKYIEKGNSMLVLRDNSVAPMVHFLPAFMTNKQITNDDLSFLTNGACDDISEAYINGQKVVEADVTCQNGYIHVVENVMEPLGNMAQMLRNDPKFSLMSSFLDRFALPVYDQSASNQYNQIYNSGTSKQDSVYVWRYLNNGFDSYRTADGNHSLITFEGEKVAEYAEVLPFDPGWNVYYDGSANATMAEDMGVIIAPTDDALNTYFNSEGAGKVLKENFGSWENVPDHIIVKLLQNLMKNSVVATVPSKFSTVVNTAQQSMGLSTGSDAIYATRMANNGVIYESNKVYSAPEYQSVSFPTLLDDKMKVMRWAIQQYQFDAYLNLMEEETKYTFVIPSDTALAFYVDPVDYYKSQKTISQFYYDDNEKKVKCNRYNMNPDGTRGDKILSPWTGVAEDDYVKNRLTDILNNSIVVANIEKTPGTKIYQTKAGGPLMFDKIEQASAGQVEIIGGYQNEISNPLTLRTEAGRYDMTQNDGNGISYIVDEAPVMTATKSLVDLLTEMKEKDSRYEKFLELLEASDLLVTNYDMVSNQYRTVSNGPTLSLMNNYNYTVYVPESEDIQKLYDADMLPTPEEITYLEENPPADMDQDVLEEIIKAKRDSLADFVRYHVQNSAIYLGAEMSTTSYETALMEGSRFTSLQIQPQGDGKYKIRCNDVNGNAIEGEGLREILSNENMLVREYHFRGRTDDAACATIAAAQRIYNSSFAAVHLISDPLFATKEQSDKYNEISGK